MLEVLLIIKHRRPNSNSSHSLLHSSLWLISRPKKTNSSSFNKFSVTSSSSDVWMQLSLMYVYVACHAYSNKTSILVLLWLMDSISLKIVITWATWKESKQKHLPKLTKPRPQVSSPWLNACPSKLQTSSIWTIQCSTRQMIQIEQEINSLLEKHLSLVLRSTQKFSIKN